MTTQTHSAAERFESMAEVLSRLKIDISGDPPSEIELLRDEVGELRREVAELRRAMEK